MAGPAARVSAVVLAKDEAAYLPACLASLAWADEVLVHEVARVEGPLGHLTQPLLHLNYASLAEFWVKQRRYSRLAAQSRRQRQGRPRGRALLGAPVRELWRRYVHLQGYRDGALGLVLALALAYFEWETVRLARTQPRQQAPDR